MQLYQKNKYKKHILIFLIFMTLSIAWYLIKIHFKLDYFWDSFIPFNPKLDLYVFSYPWNYLYTGGGSQFNYILYYFLTLPYYIGNLFYINIYNVQMLLFILVLFLSGYGMFLLLNYIYPNKKNSNLYFLMLIIISTYYMFNYYVFDTPFWDNDFLWLSYSLSPWLIFSIFKSYNAKKNIAKDFWILASLFISVPIAFFFVNYPTPDLIFFAVAFLLFIILANGKIRNKLIHLLKTYIYILFTNFWLIPYFLGTYSSNLSAYSTTGSNYHYVVSSFIQGSLGFKAYNSFFMMPSNSVLDWTVKYAPFVLIILILTLAIEFLPILFLPINKHREYYLLLTLLIIFESIMAGVYGLFGFVFNYLIKIRSPILTPFQDVDLVFGFSAVLIFSILLGSILNGMSDFSKSSKINFKFNIKKYKRPFYIVILIMAVSLMVVTEAYPWSPGVLPEQSGVDSNVTFPQYCENLANYMDKADNNHLILGLPVSGGLMGLNFSKGDEFIGNAPFPYLSGLPTVMDGHDISSLFCPLYYNAIYQIVGNSHTTNFAKFLSSENIQYVLLETNFNGNFPGGAPAYNITHLENFLNEQKNITLVKKFGPILVYKNMLPVNTISSSIPVYFNPTSNNPTGMYQFNESFFKSFTKSTDELKINNKTIDQGHLYAYNSSMLLTQYYAKGGQQASVFYSTLPVNLSSSEYPYIVVNYTSPYNVTLSVLLSNETCGQGSGGWDHVYGYSSTTGSVRVNGTKTIVFVNPDVRVKPEYFGLIISVNNPVNNTNYSLKINSMHMAKYTNYDEYPYFIMKSNATNSPVYIIKNNINTSKLAIPEYLSFKRIDPVEYIVHVNASSPYFLTLSQTFNDNWEITSDNGRIINSEHLLVNGYENGWIINNTGNYTLFIKYVPHYEFNRALADAISIGSIITIIFSLFLYDRLKKIIINLR